MARAELVAEHGTLRLPTHRQQARVRGQHGRRTGHPHADLHVKAETASAVSQRIRSVLEWAIALDMRNDNRCDRVLPVLGPQNDIVTHRQALPHRDVAEAIETVRAGSAHPAVKLAFEFLVLTATRSGEVRGAQNGLRSTRRTTYGPCRPCG